MNAQHKQLASGRWAKLSFIEQMANIGSEVHRALNWQKKGHDVLYQKAVERALELVTLTIEAVTAGSRYKELTRLREALVDYFFGENEFLSTETLWRKYFDHFTYAARKDL